MMYSINFKPKTRKVCAYSFRIQAETEKEAMEIARSLLKANGENANQFMAPRIRETTVAELLQAA